MVGKLSVFVSRLSSVGGRQRREMVELRVHEGTSGSRLKDTAAAKLRLPRFSFDLAVSPEVARAAEAAAPAMPPLFEESPEGSGHFVLSGDAELCKQHADFLRLHRDPIAAQVAAEAVPEPEAVMAKLEEIASKVSLLEQLIVCERLEPKFDSLLAEVHGVLAYFHGITAKVSGLVDDVHGITAEANGVVDDVHGITAEANGVMDDVHDLTEEANSVVDDVHGVWRILDAIAESRVRSAVEKQYGTAFAKRRLVRSVRDIARLALVEDLDGQAVASDKSALLEKISAVLADAVLDDMLVGGTFVSEYVAYHDGAVAALVPGLCAPSPLRLNKDLADYSRAVAARFSEYQALVAGAALPLPAELPDVRAISKAGEVFGSLSQFLELTTDEQRKTFALSCSPLVIAAITWRLLTDSAKVHEYLTCVNYDCQGTNIAFAPEGETPIVRCEAGEIKTSASDVARAKRQLMLRLALKSWAVGVVYDCRPHVALAGRVFYLDDAEDELLAQLSSDPPSNLLASALPMSRKGGDDERLTRIAIVNEDKCKPKRCRQECKKSCPVVRMGKLCIEVAPTSKIAWISEELCIGCGICVKKCPFEAISILNLPKSLERQTTHRYGPNSFKLHRLPMPRPGQVLGLVGTNGIGKSTALKILGGKLKPNLGNYEHAPDWQEILTYFRGSELQNYFTRLLEDNLKAIIKPQYVDHIPKAVKGTVGAILRAKDERNVAEEMIRRLDLESVIDRDVANLSGGELQRFAIAVVCVQDADIYMFDEPSSYLDVRQRLRAAETIRSLLSPEKYVIVVEHDLSVLDYLSDFVCCLYGQPGAYGVVTMPFGVREGINIFLEGKVPTENLRFRDTSLSFKIADSVEGLPEGDVARGKHTQYNYPAMTTTLGNFQLDVEAGGFKDSEIVVLVGQNGTGKTTMIRMLAGLLKPDSGVEVPELNVSYKPQKISPKYTGTVRQLLQMKIRDSFVHPQFNADVMKPMLIEQILDQGVQVLSGGELQRVAIVLCLGQPADIYLIDEPSAYLDSEQRIVASKVIKRFILHSRKTAFIVEHDFIMATYLADRVIRYTGEPARHCQAHTPEGLVTGMNAFLKDLDITFRRDPTNFRPRINKQNSVKDKEQKSVGDYFLVDAGEKD
eukprot:m51a1_g10475 putative abc transporter e family member 2-like (1134) ;mRNA; f:93217-99218